VIKGLFRGQMKAFLPIQSGATVPRTKIARSKIYRKAYDAVFAEKIKESPGFIKNVKISWGSV
jgi:hypothetical protein